MNEPDLVFDVDADGFAMDVVQASYHTPVLVDFWADWCQPCKMLMPVLAKVVQHYGGAIRLAKVNTDEQRELAMQMGIRSLPTVRLFRDGKPVAEFMGAQSESAVHAFLAPHLQAPADPRREQASTAAEQGDLDTAERILREAIQTDGPDPALSVDLASVMLAKGDADAADELLQALPGEVREDDGVAKLIKHVDFVRRACLAPDEGQLAERVAGSPPDLEAHHQLAVLRVAQGRYEEALELLLGVLRRDRKFGDDVARKEMLAIFTLLGNEEPLVSRYRGLMARAMH